MTTTLYCGDCIEVMKAVPDCSIDLVVCDLPYGVTACKWDTPIDLPQLWDAYRRICRPKAAILLHATQPFSSRLVSSNYAMYRHSWIWNKRFASNFPHAANQPLRIHEDILVFCKERVPLYRPQMIDRDKPIKLGANKSSQIFRQGQGSLNNKAYEGKVFAQKFPETILHYNGRECPDRGLHPTQKPTALIEYLIRTYSDEGGTVLDNTMGSGTTGAACARSGRNFIGIEKDPVYFEVARKRLA